MLTRPTTSCSGGALAGSELYADDHHWGSAPINARAHDLPALKIRYLLANLPATGRVLEVGCGGGRLLNTIAMHRPRLELVGCDIRPLRYAPSRFRFDVVSPGSTALPYGAATFDAVIMVDFLEHVEDPLLMLRAARDVLRQSGRLVSFTPLEGQRLSLYRLYRVLLGDDLYARTKEHIQAYSEVSLRAAVGKDFEIVDCAYAYHALGHLMDATLFAMLTAPRLRARFWQENSFYKEVEGVGPRGGRRSPLDSVLRLGNAMAYLESRVLRSVSRGAAGLLFVAVPR
jgi:SAM-dependent methyltransferase